MGFVRINIPNPHGVYMHDTPTKGIFGDDFRFVSSGCVRVQNVRDYIQFLLEGHARLEPRADRRHLQGRFADGRPPGAARQRLLDLHHRLGDPGRPRAVPRRHLQPRRLRQSDPGGEPGSERTRRGDVLELDRRLRGSKQRGRGAPFFMSETTTADGSFRPTMRSEVVSGYTTNQDCAHRRPGTEPGDEGPLMRQKLIVGQQSRLLVRRRRAVRSEALAKRACHRCRTGVSSWPKVPARAGRSASVGEAVVLWSGGYRRADADDDGIPCENVCRSLAQVEAIKKEIGC